jgi:predicted glycogen debranching enzyme
VKEELRYYNMEYEEERKRGLPWKEDLFSPGRFELELEGDVSLAIVASTWRDTMPDVQDCLAREMTRTRGLKAPVTDLAMAADSFLVKRGLGLSIIAGYHWFDDWGRDAMISLPGLLLTTGRYTEAKEVLTTFANHCRGGTLPNDLGAGSYNAADPSLWFLRALYSYYRYSEDRELVRQLWPVVTDIVDSYIQGNAVVKMDQDGLLVTEEGTTWMDARVDGVCVTPRRGKACEINALWYSALCISRALAKALRKRWEIDLEDKVKNSYQKFWNIEKGCLYDLIDPLDQSVRPNQVIAAAFAFDLLPIQQRKGIVETATLELLTPYGLRTLSPKEPGYIGRYEGNPQERDRAFHQGTVWPWLMGPYITAYMKANRRSMKTRQKAQELLRPLLEQDAPGIGSIPEVYDGDAPHRPGGCISQAWSVAEILRAWSEEGMGRKFEGSSC